MEFERFREPYKKQVPERNKYFHKHNFQTLLKAAIDDKYTQILIAATLNFYASINQITEEQIVKFVKNPCRELCKGDCLCLNIKTVSGVDMRMHTLEQKAGYVNT